MPLILPGNVGSATAATGYNVANSCRFNSGDSAYMNVTSVSTVTNRLKFTISLWVKRSTLGAKSMIGTVGGDDTNFGAIWFDSSDRLNCTEGSGGGELNFITNRVFRDVSAWYNIILAIDTTQGTESNRVKIYVNGTQETSFSTSTYPSQNSNMHLNRNGKVQYLGRHTDSSNDYYFDGYMAEVVWVDGQQLDQTSFGEFDSDSPTIWKPKDVSGLTFGNNGFYLDFEDSGDLGDDESGNGNDWGENNLAATDQSTDTCTNNFTTINSLDNYYAGSALTEGNLKQTTTNSAYSWNTTTFGLSSGRWYCEVKINDPQNTDSIVGIANAPTTSSSNRLGEQSGNVYDWGYRGDGQIGNANSVVSYTISAMSNGNIIGIYLDLDNNKLYFSINGSLQNSGTGISITAPSSTTTGNYFFAGQDRQSGDDTILEWNFGSPYYSISSGNTDDNGYGNFEYSPNITGDGSAKSFYSVNTKNLAEFG